jgi:transposase
MEIKNKHKDGINGEPRKKAPKLRRVDRSQGVLRPMRIDDLIPEEHPARNIWEFVSRLDLSEFYDSIASVEGEAGRSAFDPHLLISLWLYAYSRGVGSAREISRLCETDRAFEWLTGYQSINAHTLSDFRVSQKKGLDSLFGQVLGILSASGLVKLERVMQDGTKVQANASPKTFRKKDKIRAHLKMARDHVASMGDPNQAPNKPPKSKARNQSAARERARRIEQALEKVEKLNRDKAEKSKKNKEPRVSTTDPDARMMRHKHGGVLPSYNVQMSVDSEEKIIAAIGVTSDANDSEQLLPAMERLRETCDRKPQKVIADGDYTNHRSVKAMEDLGIDFYGSWKQVDEKKKFGWRGLSEAFYPSQFNYDSEQDVYVCPIGKTLVYRTTTNHQNGTKSRFYRASVKDCSICPHRHECCSISLSKGQGRVISRTLVSESVTSFKKKMSTDEAKQIYRQRSEVSEFPNLWFKSKNKIRQLYLRGLAKVALEMKWVALAYNIHHWFRLRPSLAGLEMTS